METSFIDNEATMDLEKVLHELFRHAYSTNCALMDEELQPEELETLNDLDSAEVLENFKDLVTDLLTYKQNCLKSEKSDLIAQNEQLEGMLQKLEGEVRTHIRVEQQLKLHLEGTQAKLDEAEKKQAELQEQLDLAEAKLSSYHEPLASPVSKLEKQLKALEERYKLEISRITLQHTSAIKNPRHCRVSSEAYSKLSRAQSRQSPIPFKKADDRGKAGDDRQSSKHEGHSQKLEEKELKQLQMIMKTRTKDSYNKKPRSASAVHRVSRSVHQNRVFM